MCSSTLRSETYVTAEGLASALWMREIFFSLLKAKYDVRLALSKNQCDHALPITQVTDAASLYHHVLKDVSWAREERTRLAILVLKEDLQQPDVSLRWSPTALQLGDALTKKDSSGNKGDKIGSAVVPSDVRIEGVMMSTVIKIMNISITNMEPPGGGGGGGDEPLAMRQRRQR